MEYEIQSASGVFQLSMGDGFIQRYDRVQNVVVRLSNRNTKNITSSVPAILLNAHFDSVPQVSPCTHTQTLRKCLYTNRQFIITAT